MKWCAQRVYIPAYRRSGEKMGGGTIKMEVGGYGTVKKGFGFKLGVEKTKYRDQDHLDFISLTSIPPLHFDQPHHHLTQ